MTVVITGSQVPHTLSPADCSCGTACHRERVFRAATVSLLKRLALSSFRSATDAQPGSEVNTLSENTGAGKDLGWIWSSMWRSYANTSLTSCLSSRTEWPAGRLISVDSTSYPTRHVFSRESLALLRCDQHHLLPECLKEPPNPGAPLPRLASFHPVLYKARQRELSMEHT